MVIGYFNVKVIAHVFLNLSGLFGMASLYPLILRFIQTFCLKCDQTCSICFFL